MGLCSAIDLTTCGPGAPTALNLPLNASFISCNPTPYVLPADYTSLQTGCCNTCSTMTFSKDIGYTNPPATVYYISCATKSLTQGIVTAGGSISDCMVDGSWFIVESDPVNGVTNTTTGPAC